MSKADADNRSASILEIQNRLVDDWNRQWSADFAARGKADHSVVFGSINGRQVILNGSGDMRAVPYTKTRPFIREILGSTSK